jgi:hypothetical protein
VNQEEKNIEVYLLCISVGVFDLNVECFFSRVNSLFSTYYFLNELKQIVFWGEKGKTMGVDWKSYDKLF